MNKITTKIYRIDASNHGKTATKDYIWRLMDTHSAKQYEKINCQVASEVFELMLFIHNPTLPGKPSWHGLLMEITNRDTKVKNIGSKYPSFILFFHSDSEIFAITGGGGHKVIESILDSQFGFKVIERLIDTSKHDIRGLSQRVFLGIELASSRFFKSDYVFADEDTFGKYYKGLDVFIDQEKLKSIGVETAKKNLLVRGESGFKIDTKISFEELLTRIQKLSTLLKEESEIELNPFKKLTGWELKRPIRENKTFEEMLDQQLIQDHYDEFKTTEAREIYHPNLMEYLKCSYIKVRLGKEEQQIPANQRMTPRLILGYLKVFDEHISFPRFLELVRKIDIWIVDEETNKMLYQTKLYEWFYGEVSYKERQYLKFENEWFNYSIAFSNDLNTRLEGILNRLEVHPMKVWSNELSDEKDYNHAFSQEKDFLVGDGIFHKNIEIADLISWTDDEVIVYHVKNGLDRNLRVLQNQIINSAKMLLEFRSHIGSEDVVKYHERLKNENAKYHISIPDLEDFKKILTKSKVRFVFGFATRTAHTTKEEIIEEIKSSRSTVAKMAVLYTFYSIKALGEEFSIAKIIRKN